MKSVLSIILVLSATSVFAQTKPISIDQIKCSADKFPFGRVDIPVKMTLGAAPDQKTYFGGSEIAVGFGPGNRYEPQQLLSMEVDGNTTSVYDPKNGSLYILETKSRVKLQCYIKELMSEVPVEKNLICDSYNSQLINLDNGEAIYDFSSNENCEDAKKNVLLGKPFCDTYDSTLYTSDAVLIYDFASNSNCTEAIERVHQKKNFCDYYDSTLRKSNGDLIYDFSSNADCKKALN